MRGDNPLRSQLRPERNTWKKQGFKDPSERPKSCTPPSIQPLKKLDVQDQYKVSVDLGIRFDSLTPDWRKQQDALAGCRGVKLSEQLCGFCTCSPFGCGKTRAAAKCLRPIETYLRRWSKIPGGQMSIKDTGAMSRKSPTDVGNISHGCGQK